MGATRSAALASALCLALASCGRQESPRETPAVVIRIPAAPQEAAPPESAAPDPPPDPGPVEEMPAPEPTLAERAAAAWSLWEEGRHADALADAASVRAEDPDQPAACLLLGRDAYRRHDLFEAEDLLARAERGGMAHVTALLERVRAELEVEAQFRSSLATPGFELRYSMWRDDLGTREGSRTMSELLWEARRHVERMLGPLPGNERVQVLIYDPATFARLMDMPEWVAGVYDGRVRIPLDDLYENSQLSDTVRHELVHAFVDRLSTRCPAWLNEGLAQWVEGEDLARAAARLGGSEGWLPYSDLVRPFLELGSEARVRRAYDQGLLFVAWLDRVLGRGVIVQGIEALGREGAAEQVLAEEWGVSPADLYRDWLLTRAR